MPLAVKFNSLCLAPPLPPTPHSPRVIFGALLISPLFPTNKGDAWRETSQIHTTSSRRSRPRRHYQNHPQPRRCTRLINLQLIHPTFAKCVFLCSGFGRYEYQEATRCA